MAEQSKILDISEVGYESGLRSLCTDMTVGALLVPSMLSTRDVERLKASEGKGVSHTLSFANVLKGVRSYFDEYPSAVVEEGGAFNNDHPWHVFVTSAETPKVRVWTHITGPVVMYFARSNRAITTDCMYSATPEEISANTFAAPVSHTPNDGDALLFIDNNLPEETGHGTFHKTRVPLGQYANRISIACDITLLPAIV